MKVKILDRYIISQVMFASLGCIIVFMIVWIMPEILIKTIQRTISGAYTIDTAIAILLNEMPKVLNIAIPVGVLLGSLMTFEKLSKDFEITVLRASGFSFMRIIASVIIFSIFACGLTFAVGSKFLPVAACNLKKIKGDFSISQFVFPVKNADGSLNKVLIVPKFDTNNIKDVIVLDFYKNNRNGSSLLSGIIVSDYVKYVDEKWIINKAKDYDIAENGVFNEIDDIENYVLLEGESAKNAFKLMKYSVYRDRELTNAQITEYIKLLHKEKMDDEYNYMLNKFIQRFTHSFMCILFAILGCLLGFSRPREQKYIGMLGAVGVIFGYYITMPFFDLLAEKSVIPPYFTALIAPICITTVIFAVKKIKNL